MTGRVESATDRCSQLRIDIVQNARTWIGTPYAHQASCRGAGTDCLGLLRGVWREVLGKEPESVPPYTADWSELDQVERLLEGAERHLIPVQPECTQQGDVLVFRMRERGVAKHLGILAFAPEGHPTVIHAYSGQTVVESPLTPAWSRRIAAVFRFPDRR